MCCIPLYTSLRMLYMLAICYGNGALKFWRWQNFGRQKFTRVPRRCRRNMLARKPNDGNTQFKYKLIALLFNSLLLAYSSCFISNHVKLSQRY